MRAWILPVVAGYLLGVGAAAMAGPAEGEPGRALDAPRRPGVPDELAEALAQAHIREDEAAAHWVFEASAGVPLSDWRPPKVYSLVLPASLRAVEVDAAYASTASLPEQALVLLAHADDPAPRPGADHWAPALRLSGLEARPFGDVLLSAAAAYRGDDLYLLRMALSPRPSPEAEPGGSRKGPRAGTEAQEAPRRATRAEKLAQDECIPWIDEDWCEDTDRSEEEEWRALDPDQRAGWAALVLDQDLAAELRWVLRATEAEERWLRWGPDGPDREAWPGSRRPRGLGGGRTESGPQLGPETSCTHAGQRTALRFAIRMVFSGDEPAALRLLGRQSETCAADRWTPGLLGVARELRERPGRVAMLSTLRVGADPIAPSVPSLGSGAAADLASAELGWPWFLGYTQGDDLTGELHALLPFEVGDRQWEGANELAALLQSTRTSKREEARGFAEVWHIRGAAMAYRGLDALVASRRIFSNEFHYQLLNSSWSFYVLGGQRLRWVEPFKGAIPPLERAIELVEPGDCSYDETRYLRALSLYYTGARRESVAAAERALRVCPRSPWAPAFQGILDAWDLGGPFPPYPASGAAHAP